MERGKEHYFGNNNTVDVMRHETLCFERDIAGESSTVPRQRSVYTFSRTKFATTLPNRTTNIYEYPQINALGCADHSQRSGTALK